jgi:preprotein translocase subunit SecF
MYEIIKNNTQIDFTGKFAVAAIFSSVVVIVSLYFAIFHMSYGVDFRGGAEIQIKFEKNVPLGELRKALLSHDFKSATVQTIGAAAENEVLVKAQAKEGELNEVADRIKNMLKTTFASEGASVRKIDIVGPKAGAELRLSGFESMLFAMLAIMIYVGLRFEFKYSPGAIIALFHDVSIILGVFALTGTDFTLQTVAAILAVIGYSVNDTVIIYDRVREHEQKYSGVSIGDNINSAINSTLSRTLLTSGTTLFVSASMFFFGGPAIKDFFMAITLGVVVGTYSSVFIASPVVLFLDKWNSKKAVA